MKEVLIATVFLGALAAGGSYAYAQPVAQGSIYKGDVAAFHGDSRSLIRAIRMIRLGSGDRVVDIRFEVADGHPGYDVVLQRQGRVVFQRIDEQGGMVTALTSINMPQWVLDWNQRQLLKVDRRTYVPLAQAIRTAENANNNAPAIAAGIARSADNPMSDVHAYNVLLAMNGSVKRVAVDSLTGLIIADPQALNY